MEYLPVILCIEDDLDDLATIRESIQEHSNLYSVVEVHNGKDALLYLQQMKDQGKLPCLVIMDVNMPLMDGKKTLRHLKNDPAYSSIPIAIFSTSSNPSDQFYFKQFQVHYEIKPHHYPLFKEKVKSLVASLALI
jgi:CheY-like chemotaxis protein